MKVTIDHRESDGLDFDLTGFEALADGIRKHLPNKGGDMQEHFDFTRAPTVRRIETPAARNSDPETSHLAAEAITISGVRHAQLEQTIQAVDFHPGMTSHELSQKTGLDRYMLARRLPEAVTAGRVVKGISRECAVTGHKATTWLPVDDQRAVAA